LSARSTFRAAAVASDFCFFCCGDIVSAAAGLWVRLVVVGWDDIVWVFVEAVCEIRDDERNRESVSYEKCTPQVHAAATTQSCECTPLLHSVDRGGMSERHSP
jgi:hypothetical protein